MTRPAESRKIALVNIMDTSPLTPYRTNKRQTLNSGRYKVAPGVNDCNAFFCSLQFQGDNILTLHINLVECLFGYRADDDAVSNALKFGGLTADLAGYRVEICGFNFGLVFMKYRFGKQLWCQHRKNKRCYQSY